MNDVSGNDLFNISNAKQKTTLYQNSLIQGRTSTNNSNIADIDLALPILFNSPSQQDYNLASNSPLINKGNNALYTGDITTDKDLAGKSRLSGTTIDIGAYEYVNTIPKVTSINRIGNEIVPASTMSIAYEVKFSEAVTGVDSSDFVLTSTGTAIGTVKNINGNGDTYIVTVHNLSGTGTLRLDLDATNTDITNILGASINESFTTGQVFIIDRDAPKVSTINVPADGTYKKDEVLDFIVTFNEKVNITGTPQLDLNIGTKTVQADYISGIGTTDLKFSYTVHATDLSLNGIAINGIKLNPNDKIEDEAGNNAILTLNSIPSTVGIIVIGTQADLMITASVDNLTIKYGETVTPTITVTNNGLDDATNVNVTAFLPTGFQYINSTNSGSYEEGKVNWKLPTLAKGENKTLIFQLKANKVVESATISATTSSDMYDPNESNNTASTAFEVKKADFSGLTFEDKTETFNGLSHAVIVNNLPIDAKVKYELSDEKGNKTENNSAINAGTYTVKATVSQENYTDWVETVKLTITSAPLTVTADTQTKVYGKNDPTLTYQITEGQLIGTDILTGELGRNIGENVGSYAITQGALVTNPNYDLTFISKNLTVTPAPLTITAKNADKTYDSLAYTGGNGIEYDGFVNNETESILIGSLIYSGNSQNAVNTGNYEIIPSGLNNNNYTITYVKGTLTISLAQITGITFSDESFTYDGSSKSIQIKGDLPTGTTVSYVGNNKTEVGTYGVLATIDGGINYQNQTLNANLKINQATISGITFSDKNFYYDGLPKSIEIKGALPTGTTVSYIGNGKTETGTHAVVAIIDGGNNYQNQTLNANLIINKSKITGITFNDESFLYDGTPKSIEIRGTLPTGATVSYTGNEQTEGGTYPITATIDGGDNYKSYVLHANLTIDLVFQTINWEEELVNMSPDEEKYISATSSSMLDVSFKSSDPAIAEVQYDKSKEKWILKAKKIGEVSITAHQEGNNNYFPAHPITQSLNIVPKLGLENDFLGDKYKRNLIIVPNPSRQRERFKLLADFSEKDLIGAKIIISDLTGKIYNEINKIERTTLIQAPLTANVYIVNLFLSDGRKASSKLLVK
ncbi:MULTISPECIES: MBG domain-containing protein [unclassified Empedobacter]|uniref:MBG domain-containing protein n=1 Tax=unclassified Empedobacter TaxID=2643773 RepID=UPI0025BC0F62|nr:MULTISPECIES: MBG domain-containing protein [unclassified Empedobacter]